MPPENTTYIPSTTPYDAAMTSAEQDWEEPPVPHWCFDFMVFYRSFNDSQSKIIVQDLEDYSRFSFFANGLITTLLTMFGLAGNILLMHQIQRTRYFSRRLACHLAMLCCWDMALLLSCLLTYGISCLYYGIIPFVGVVAYLLFIFQPFASFCTTGTIWQVLAITVERYMAVSRPLEQRTRNAQFSVRTICAAVVVVGFILNMTPMIFEHELTDCYEIQSDHVNISYNIRTMIIPKPVIYIQSYAILVHLLPDILFRAPTPIIVIAFLTVRTMQICSKRQIGTHTIHARRNVPYMLTILNLKFILCNTLYMFNTILMEVLGYGGKVSSTQTELEVRQYLQSLYLTDFSNMLLAVHSATNWLIFYHWPAIGKSKKVSTMTQTSQSGSKKEIKNKEIIDTESAELLLSRFSPNKHRICVDVLATLCVETPGIAIACIGSDYDQSETKEFFAQHIKIQKYGAIMANSIEDVFISLTQNTIDVRAMCYDLGYKYYMAFWISGSHNLHHRFRDVMIAALTQSNYPKWYSNKLYQSNNLIIQKSFTTVFKMALGQMRNGALCSGCDAKNGSRKPKPPSFHNGNGIHPKDSNPIFIHHRSIDGAEIPERRKQSGGIGATVKFVRPHGVILPRTMSLDFMSAPRDSRHSTTTTSTSNSVNVAANGAGDDSSNTDDSFVDLEAPRVNANGNSCNGGAGFAL